MRVRYPVGRTRVEFFLTAKGKVSCADIDAVHKDIKSGMRYGSCLMADGTVAQWKIFPAPKKLQLNLFGGMPWLPQSS
jgi:hypothetical protein